MLMGQKPEWHLAVLELQGSCALQLSSSSLLPIISYPSSKLLPSSVCSWGDPTLNPCQSWKTQVAATQFQIQPRKSQLSQHLQRMKLIQKQ